jgi:AcrR family transcriptional regulator
MPKTAAPPSEVAPGPSRAPAMPPEERRSMIVAATLPLLIEHGEMVTTRQIADAAGIAEGTIFRAFPDKDALLAAAVDAVLDIAPMERAMEAIDPSLPLVDALTEAVVALQSRVVRVWRLASAIGPRFHDASRKGLTLSPALVELCRAHRAELSVPPAEAARLLHAITLAVTHPSLAETPMKPAVVVQRFLHGVGAGGPSC